MLIETKYLGEVEIDESKLLTFPSGLPGFNDEKQFVLLNFPGSDTFQILQSVANKNLAFIVTNPYHFYDDYEIKLDNQIRTVLQIERPDDVLILAIVTLKDTIYKSTMNLKAPLIINRNSMHGKQYILNDQTYSMKTLLAPTEELRAKGE